MNGPRMNQFVAPTSFITSISRRREKIESRIVFAISIVAATSRITVAIVKITSITCATWSTRLESFLPVVDRRHARRQRLQASSRSRRGTPPSFGVISSESGSGLNGRFLTSSG